MTMNYSIFDSNQTIKACVILALIIIIAYSPMIFLDQINQHSGPIGPRILGYEGKQFKLATIDPGADFMSHKPIKKLASDLFNDGTLPLWNPYMGGGNPLAADTTNYIFSPISLGLLIPIQFWDYTLIASLWLAGFFMFLFLRNLKLSFVSSISGATFYMLSGAFTWYIPHTYLAVMVFTPFIFYSLEKLISNRHPKYIALTSLALCFGILGAHIESIILQFIFAGLYLAYRIIYPLVSKYLSNVKNKIPEKILDSNFSVKRIIISAIIALFGGIGLSAFFLIPVFELISISSLPHESGAGLVHFKNSILSFPFIPYSLGTVQDYWNLDLKATKAWSGLWGYVGIFSLFYSILAVIFYIKNKEKNLTHRFTPIFFLAVSIFFMMKSFGVPIVNLIGTLPVLDLLVFTRHVGVIIPFGFSVCASFGIFWLSKIKTNTTQLGIACGISVFIISLFTIPLLPFLAEGENFAQSISEDLIRYYVALQCIQAVTFGFIAFLSAVAISKNKSVIVVIIPLILLELSFYIPMGLNYWWIFYKFLIILIGMLAIIILTLKPNRFFLEFKKS